MFSRGLRQFYIEEVSQLTDGRLVVPHNWIVRHGDLTADCSLVSIMQNGWSIGGEIYQVAASEFKWNYHDVLSRIGGDIPWAGENLLLLD